MKVRFANARRLALACALALLLRPAAGEEKPVIVSVPGLFSYHAPPGWSMLTLPQIPNPVSVDSRQQSPRPWIQVDGVHSQTPLAQFVAENEQRLKEMVPGSKIVEEAPFLTTANAHGVRVVVRSKPHEHEFQAVYYFFDAPYNTKLMIFANGLAPAFERNAPLFDEAIRTLVID
jgi:hypothetical protein